MICSNKKYALDEICTIDINCDIETICHLLAARPNETIFVIDEERYLYGIITIGDYFRKAAISKNAEGLLNKNYKKIETGTTEEVDIVNIEETAEKIFIDTPNITKVPVVNNAKLLYVIGSAKVEIGELWATAIENLERERELLQKHYIAAGTPRATVIFVYVEECGVTDNIKGAITVYKICEILGLQFKINITGPLNLVDFLLPSTYDWRITPEEFEVAVQENNICEFSLFVAGVCDSTPFIPVNKQVKLIDQIKTKSENRGYLLVKTSILAVSGNEYGELYDKLFQPTLELREANDMHLRQIGGDFVAAAFRFMQLLGDFVEAPFYQSSPILEPSEREMLLGRCLEHLEEIHKENPGKRILVASDSISFLAAMRELPYAYVVPGEIAHPAASHAPDADKSVWMKFFLDYFLLKSSKKIYQVVDSLMYRSAIPQLAAWHGKVPLVVRDYFPKAAFNTAVLQLYRFLDGDVSKGAEEKERLLQQALVELEASLWPCKNIIMDIREKLHGDGAQNILKELFNSNSPFTFFYRALHHLKT